MVWASRPSTPASPNRWCQWGRITGQRRLDVHLAGEYLPIRLAVEGTVDTGGRNPTRASVQSAVPAISRGHNQCPTALSSGRRVACRHSPDGRARQPCRIAARQRSRCCRWDRAGPACSDWQAPAYGSPIAAGNWMARACRTHRSGRSNRQYSRSWGRHNRTLLRPTSGQDGSLGLAFSTSSFLAGKAQSHWVRPGRH